MIEAFLCGRHWWITSGEVAADEFSAEESSFIVTRHSPHFAEWPERMRSGQNLLIKASHVEKMLPKLYD